MSDIDPKTAQELEAAVFQRLVKHLRERPEVQNIDLMNLANFCRNCLSNWYRDAAEEKGIELSKDASREIVYLEAFLSSNLSQVSPPPKDSSISSFFSNSSSKINLFSSLVDRPI